MANKRIYDEVQGLLLNGISVGGVTSIAVEEGFENEIQNSFDGAQGPTAHELSKAYVKSTVRTTDVLKMIDILISAPGAGVTEWYGAQSGLATMVKGTLLAPVFHALDFQASDDFAVATLQAQHRFALAADTFQTIHTLTESIDPDDVDRTHPNRLFRIKSCTHGAQAIQHIQSLSFRLAARLITDSGDADVGQTAVERGGFGDVTLSLAFRDSAKASGGAYDLSTLLLNAGVKDLVIVLDGAGEVTDKTLTLRNCRFTNRQRNGQEGWTGFTMQGRLVFRDPADPWTVRTVNHATAAERLINIA